MELGSAKNVHPTAISALQTPTNAINALQDFLRILRPILARWTVAKTTSISTMIALQRSVEGATTRAV